MPACDPRGGGNRALLVGVPEYAHKAGKYPGVVPGDLLAVRASLVELAATLRAGGVFAPDTGRDRPDHDGECHDGAGFVGECHDGGGFVGESHDGADRDARGGGSGAGGGGLGAGVVAVEPSGTDDFHVLLGQVAAETRGVLLFYFAGHGAVPFSGDELWLQLPGARTVPGEQQVFVGSVPLTTVLSVLATSPARQIVVILDCCFAGNAARVLEGFEQRRRFFLVAAVQANRRIDAGPAETPTPFTAALLDVLRGAAPGRPVTFSALGPALRKRMAGHRTLSGEPWVPQLRQGDPDADVELARADDVPVPPPRPAAPRPPAVRHDARQPAPPAPPPPEPVPDPVPVPVPVPDPEPGRDLRPEPGAAPAPASAQPASRQPTGAGPASGGPASPQPTRPHPTGAEPAVAEPATTGPATIEPATAEPPTAEPPTAEPSPTGPASPGRRTRRRRAPRPAPREVGRRWSRPRWSRRWAVAASAAAVVLALVGTLLYAAGDSPTARACAPPQELRVLTDPDLHRVVRDAAQTYTLSPANHPDGACARVGITVYAARTSDVITAFHDLSNVWQKPPGQAPRPTDGAPADGAATGGASTGGVSAGAAGEGAEPSAAPLDPQRDVGAQPDLWIPASVADVERAHQASQDVRFVNTTHPIGYSPTALALPAPPGSRETGPRSGRLADLVDAFLDGGSGRHVRRPDPESTDAALFATRALYGAQQAGAVERRLAHAGPLAPDGAGLLCALAGDRKADRRTAAVVPEYLLRSGALECGAQTRVPRRVVYPDDVPALAPVAVSLAWEGADQDSDTARARAAGITSFSDWLAGPEGQRTLRRAGFWSKDGEPPPGGARVSGGPGVLPSRTGPTGADLGRVLERYRAASGPGRVLYLLDTSPSMTGVWNDPDGAPALLARSMEGLGPRDEYGAWRVAAPDEAERPYDTGLLGFGTHEDRAAAERELLERVRPTEHEADPYGALRDAVAEVARRGAGDERPGVVVLLTDDEDNGREGARVDLAGLLAAVRERGVPVAVVSFSSRGCDAGQPDRRIADASDGTCLDQRDDQMAGLRDAVAQTAEGDQGDAA
ncbi:substrate-binding domain-containing protein [Streptomyces buecherae]|uniref:substrate-binding domain-containing protein n=1 Tax=Streptomyces buecherae TaxID=2763006 RepID=UPI00369615D2